jgi:hypothetical protein
VTKRQFIGAAVLGSDRCAQSFNEAHEPLLMKVLETSQPNVS